MSWAFVTLTVQRAKIQGVWDSYIRKYIGVSILGIVDTVWGRYLVFGHLNTESNIMVPYVSSSYIIYLQRASNDINSYLDRRSTWSNCAEVLKGWVFWFGECSGCLGEVATATQVAWKDNAACEIGKPRGPRDLMMKELQ